MHQIFVQSNRQFNQYYTACTPLQQVQTATRSNEVGTCRVFTWSVVRYELVMEKSATNLETQNVQSTQLQSGSD